MAGPYNPNSLPAEVREAFKMGAIAWMLAVQRAVEAGIVDLNQLTDMVFHMHHPERNGQSINSGEALMIDQWKAFRTLIKPTIPAHLKSKSKPTSEPTTHDDDEKSTRWALRLVRRTGTRWTFELLNVESHRAHRLVFKGVGKNVFGSSAALEESLWLKDGKYVRFDTETPLNFDDFDHKTASIRPLLGHGVHALRTRGKEGLLATAKLRIPYVQRRGWIAKKSTFFGESEIRLHGSCRVTYGSGKPSKPEIYYR